MFVVNFKLDLKKILILCVFIALIVATIIEFGTNGLTTAVNSQTTKNDQYDIILTDDNFTATLKEVHENIDANVGKTVKLTGFVFKMPDFKDGYFVCGRNTINNKEDVVAGFLCQSDEASKLVDNEWIEVTGVIIKGEYNATMPIIQVGSLKKITAPANTFVKNVNEQ